MNRASAFLSARFFCPCIRQYARKCLSAFKAHFICFTSALSRSRVGVSASPRPSLKTSYTILQGLFYTIKQKTQCAKIGDFQRFKHLFFDAK